MLPRVAEEKLAEFCDVFTDKGYYTLDETEEILAEASRLGLKTKVHADELYNTESARLAAQIGASSADHLLCISEQGMKALAESDTVATLLPGTAYFLGLPYAPARRLISSGACVAIASDCNPGSCFSENMQLMMSLACTQMKMSMEETLHAATINGAKALHLDSICGSLEVGKSADFVLMNTPAYTDVMYHFGVNHAQEVWIAGRREIVNY
jgi:imidazolonepropionase